MFCLTGVLAEITKDICLDADVICTWVSIINFYHTALLFAYLFKILDCCICSDEK